MDGAMQAAKANDCVELSNLNVDWDRWDRCKTPLGSFEQNNTGLVSGSGDDRGFWTSR